MLGPLWTLSLSLSLFVFDNLIGAYCIKLYVALLWNFSSCYAATVYLSLKTSQECKIAIAMLNSLFGLCLFGISVFLLFYLFVCFWKYWFVSKNQCFHKDIVESHLLFDQECKCWENKYLLNINILSSEIWIGSVFPFGSILDQIALFKGKKSIISSFISDLIINMIMLSRS